MNTNRALGTSAKQRMVSFCVNEPVKLKNANNIVRQQNLKPNKVARSCVPLGKPDNLMIC